MSVLVLQQAEREALRAQANREELVERIGRALREDGTIQPLPRLYLSRSSLPLKPLHSVLEPSLCVIAQGSKEVLFGDSRYRYDPSNYLLATVELPRVSQVLEASSVQSWRRPATPHLQARFMSGPSERSEESRSGRPIRFFASLRMTLLMLVMRCLIASTSLGLIPAHPSPDDAHYA